MKIKRITNLIGWAVLTAILLSPSGAVAQKLNAPARYVNPFIGTAPGLGTEQVKSGRSGNTFPGAALPFGMVQFSPDTERGFSRGMAGSYVYGDKRIKGFSLNRFSGAGCQQFGDLPVMPFAGKIERSPATEPERYYAGFSHDREQAEPGFYRAALDGGIDVSLTATERTGFAVFKFPAGAAEATVLFHAGRNATQVRYSEARFVGDKKLVGSIVSGNFCGTGNTYKIHFVVEFERPVLRSGTWQNEAVTENAREVKGRQTGAYAVFDASQGREIKVKIGVSFVSIENAELNLRTENGGWDFAAVRKRASARWNEKLARVEIKSGSETDRRTFYSALYRALLHPNVFSDVNGEYRGFDDKIHRTKRTIYANFSGWDVYRTQFPLLAFLFPKEASDIAESMVLAAREGGGLPVWSVANDETGVMGGDPAAPMLANLYAFGARNFDAPEALRAMVKGASVPETRLRRKLQRPGLAEYLKSGYVPVEYKIETPVFGAASVTLEYALGDYAIAEMAKSLGEKRIDEEFRLRSRNWKNLWDERTKLIRPRHADGRFVEDFDILSEKNFVEGNAVQYTWMIPHDTAELFVLIGRKQTVKRLDDFFTKLNAGRDQPYFYIGNEPIFGAPWLYNFAGEPAKTQAVVRRIMRELFTAEASGLPGNDDLGATSAWYVCAALGLYPAIPGKGGFSLNAPLFDSTVIRFENRKKLEITAKNADVNFEVKKAQFNNQPLGEMWLDFERVKNGGTLEFETIK